MITRRSISRHILDYCERNNITQKDLSLRVGVKQQSLNNWVWEYTNPSFENLNKLQSVIGTLEEKSDFFMHAPYYLCYDNECDGVRLTMLKPNKNRAKIFIKYDNEEQMLKLIYEDYFIVYTLCQSAYYEKYYSLLAPFLKWRKKNKDTSAREWFKTCSIPSFYEVAMERGRDYDCIKSRIVNRVYILTEKLPYADEDFSNVKFGIGEFDGPCLEELKNLY